LLCIILFSPLFVFPVLSSSQFRAVGLGEPCQCKPKSGFNWLQSLSATDRVEKGSPGQTKTKQTDRPCLVLDNSEIQYLPDQLLPSSAYYSSNIHFSSFLRFCPSFIPTTLQSFLQSPIQSFVCTLAQFYPVINHLIALEYCLKLFNSLLCTTKSRVVFRLFGLSNQNTVLPQSANSTINRLLLKTANSKQVCQKVPRTCQLSSL